MTCMSRAIGPSSLRPDLSLRHVPKIQSAGKCHTCGSYNLPGIEVLAGDRIITICQNCTNYLYYGHDNPRPEVWADYEEGEHESSAASQK